MQRLNGFRSLSPGFNRPGVSLFDSGSLAVVPLAIVTMAVALVAFLLRQRGLIFLQFNVEAQTLDFVAEHVEADRRAWFKTVLALDHAFINFGASVHVVGLHRKQF